MRKKYNSVTIAPFCFSNPSINDMIKTMLLVMIPQIIMLVVTESIYSLVLLAITVLAAIIAEWTYNIMHKKGLKLSWSSLLQGVIIGMLLPSGYPMLVAFTIPFLILFFQKMIFSDFAQSWINPVVFAIIIMYFISPRFFPDFLLLPEYVQYPNVGTRLFSDGIIHVTSFDETMTDIFNSDLFYTLGISIPEGYFTLFWDTQSLIPAFRFNLLTIFASLILISYKAVDFIIPLVFLIVYAVLVRMFSLYPYGNTIGSGDILLALLTSGTLFSAFFLLGWFGTIPVTIIGKILYATCAGILSFLICGAGTSSVGTVFTVLMLNVLSPFIQYIEDLFQISKLRKLLTSTGIGQR